MLALAKVLVGRGEVAMAEEVVLLAGVVVFWEGMDSQEAIPEVVEALLEA